MSSPLPGTFRNGGARFRKTWRNSRLSPGCVDCAVSMSRIFSRFVTAWFARQKGHGGDEWK